MQLDDGNGVVGVAELDVVDAELAADNTVELKDPPQKKPARYAGPGGLQKAAEAKMAAALEAANVTSLGEAEKVDDRIFRQLPDWATSKAIRCAKCQTVLAPDVDEPPQGWVAQGRNRSAWKCGPCNTLCVLINRQGLSLKEFNSFSPLEASTFFKNAAGCTGQKLKEDAAYDKRLGFRVHKNNNKRAIESKALRDQSIARPVSRGTIRREKKQSIVRPVSRGTISTREKNNTAM